MKKLFSIIAVAIFMFIGSTNNAMAQHHHHHDGSAIIERVAEAIEHANEHGSYGSYNSHSGMTHFVGENCTCESSCSVCRVTRVEKCVDQTVVHFVFQPTEDTHIDIVGNTELKDLTGGLTSYLRATSNIYTDQSINVSAGESHEFTMIFPAVTLKCQSIEIVVHYPNHDLTFRVHGLPATYQN